MATLHTCTGWRIVFQPKISNIFLRRSCLTIGRQEDRDFLASLTPTTHPAKFPGEFSGLRIVVPCNPAMLIDSLQYSFSGL